MRSEVRRSDDPTEDDVSAIKRRLRDVAGKGASRDRAGREPVTSIAKVEVDRARKNSREKGNRAELDVAEAFSRWSGEVVRRTPGSGGWSNAKFGVTADLVCANRAFPFHVEVKHREGWTLDDLVTGARREHDKSIVQWWRQCVESCPRPVRAKYDAFHKEPLLVFRRNRQPWLVMMRPEVGHTHVNACAAAQFTLPYAPSPDVVVAPLSVFLDLEPVPRGLKNHRRT